jgi:iron complex outermembrane recepter protein
MPALLVLSLATALAQQSSSSAAPPPAELERPREPVVELSPFVVSASDDRGYQAQDSLSGSRLKTSLKDLATPVTAFTEQFLLDTAITNTDDLARYMVNTSYDLNEEAGGQNGQITSITRPLKMRGLGGGDVTINFFKVGSRMDTFSTERIEQARGPNAILFGVGSPGGLINATTKRARLNQTGGSAAVQARSYDGTRVEGDYNQVVLANRLAFRLAAVASRTNSWRNYAFNDADRLFGTLKFKPTPKAELNAEFETGRMTRAVKRTFTALDAYTPWRDAGRNLSNTANAALGIGTLGTNNYIVYDAATNTLTNWRTKMKTTNASNIAGQARVLTDFSVLPRETAINGPGFEQSDDYTRLSAFFTYAFTRNLNLELAAVRNDSHVIIQDNQQAFEQYLYADPNPTLPNGQPNPNAGRAYLESTPLRALRDVRNERGRAMISSRHEFGRWGTHTLAGVAEYGYTHAPSQQLREYIISPTAPNLASPENVNNRIYRRTYVDLNGPSSAIVMANPWANNPSGLTETLGGRTYESALIPFSAGTQITDVETKSMIAMLQSSFWRNRVNTIVGGSRDQRTVFRSTQERVPQPGFTSGILRAVRSQTGVEDPTATNYAFSANFRATDSVSVSYSTARNNDVPVNTAAIIYTSDSRFPAAKGQSEDVGVKFTLLENRVFLSAIYFQTSSVSENEFSTGVSNADMNNIWGALNRDGIIDPRTGRIAAASPESSTAQTFDQRTQGYELELTANLTPNWRLFLVGSRSRTARTNIGPEMLAHLAEVRPLWEANRTRALATPSGAVQTIGAMLTEIDRQIETNYRLADGRLPIGQVPHKLALRSTYEFSRGSLNGVGVGGGARYLGRPVIGFVPGSIDAGGNLKPFSYFYGSEQAFVDLNLSYRRKVNVLGRSVMWSLRLNIDNVFNNDAFVRMRVSESGALQNYRFNDPREWILTSRFAF